MKKADLRKKYSELRNTFSGDEILAASKKISETFLKNFQLYENQKVHCYLSLLNRNEIDTRFLLDYFFRNKVRVYVPKIMNDQMISVEIDSETSFIKGFYGIPEPESMIDSEEKIFDFVITPLLYCDQKGNRVGYGKGFYDAFFKTINADAKKTGLGLYAPIEGVDDLREDDVKLDYLIMPEAVLSF